MEPVLSPADAPSPTASALPITTPPPPPPVTPPPPPTQSGKSPAGRIIVGIVGIVLVGVAVWWFIGRLRPEPSISSGACTDSTRQATITQAVQPYRGQSGRFVYEVESEDGPCPGRQYVSVDLETGTVSLYHTGAPYTEGGTIGAYWRAHRKTILSQLGVPDTFRLAITPTGTPRMADGTYFLEPRYAPNGNQFAVLGGSGIEIRDAQSTEVVQTYPVELGHTSRLEDWDGADRFLLSELYSFTIFHGQTNQRSEVLSIATSDTKPLFGQYVEFFFGQWYFLTDDLLLIDADRACGEIPVSKYFGRTTQADCPEGSPYHDLLFVGQLTNGQLTSVTKLDEANSILVIGR